MPIPPRSCAADKTEFNTPQIVRDLAPPLSAALAAIQCDPTPITALLQRLLGTVPFTHIIALTTPEQLLTTLESPSPAVQQLGLFILRKAATSESEAAVVADWPEVTATLVKLALEENDTGSASMAGDVLVALLERDRNVGILWRRVFSLGGGMYKGKSTALAYGRLLDIVGRLAERVGWDAVAGATDGELLAYVADTRVRPAEDDTMVRPEEDVFVHILLLEFYGALLAAAPREAWAYLRAHGKAAKVTTIALAPESATEDELDRGLLQGHAAHVLARAITALPEILDQPTTPDVTTLLAEDVIEAVRANLEDPYAGPHAPTLTLLCALPPARLAGNGVVGLVPLSPPYIEFLDVLAGLLRNEALFREYAAANNQMWELVVKYASAPALGEVAEAAFGIIEAVADWGVLEVVKAPGVMLLLANSPERGFGGDVGEGVARRRYEAACKVLEKLPARNGWKEVLEKRKRAGVWGAGGHGIGGEVATMRM